MFGGNLEWVEEVVLFNFSLVDLCIRYVGIFDKSVVFYGGIVLGRFVEVCILSFRLV